MKRFGRYMVMGFAVAAAFDHPIARAHEQLKSGAWCASGQVRYDGNFSFSQALLEQYALCVRSGNCGAGWGLSPGSRDSPTLAVETLGARKADPLAPESSLKCGQFEDRFYVDDYGIARRLATQHCGQFGPTPTAGASIDTGTAVAVVIFPDSFNAENHHEAYTLSQRLKGTCAICAGEGQGELPFGGTRTAGDDSITTSATPADGSSR